MCGENRRASLRAMHEKDPACVDFVGLWKGVFSRDSEKLRSAQCSSSKRIRSGIVLPKTGGIRSRSVRRHVVLHLCVKKNYFLLIANLKVL